MVMGTAGVLSLQSKPGGVVDASDRSSSDCVIWLRKAVFVRDSDWFGSHRCSSALTIRLGISHDHRLSEATPSIPSCDM
eukprot:6398300-Prymnesium_polylepis.1